MDWTRHPIPHDPAVIDLTYVAGPMSLVGPPTWNYPAFMEMAEKLRGAGYEVINPADLHEPSEDLPHDWYLRRDLAQLVKCNRIVLLENHHMSKGARLERHVAIELGMEVIHPHQHEKLFNA